MLPSEAGLTVTLGVRAGAVASVGIASTRLIQAAGLLAGRNPAQVTTLLPTLYALCGSAQGLAGLVAIEAAVGFSPSPGQRMARRLLLLLETLSEHALAVLRDWPDLLGETADLAAAKPLRATVSAVRRALYPDGDWTRPGGGRLVIERTALAERVRLLRDLISHLFAAPPDDVLDGFDAWRNRSDAVAARLLRRIEDDGLAGFGRSAIPAMPERGPGDLMERLAGDHDGTYVARPDWHGQAPETNCLSRRGADSMIAELMARHGNGLLPRFAARLIEIGAALREVEDLVQDLTDDADPAPLTAGDGVGLGRIDAARGLLVHRVEIGGGMVQRYQILAPTEWNFHPAGALAAGLTGAVADDRLLWRARLLVAALDPCVACRVEIAPDA